MKCHLLIVAAMIGACVGACASVTSAAVYLIDFNDVGPAPTLGGVWNVIGHGLSDTTWALKDTAGSEAAGITLRFSNAIQDSSVVQAGVAQDRPWADPAAVADYLYVGTDGSGDTAGEMRIEGLDDNLLYTLELVSTRTQSGTISRELAVTANGLAPDNYPTGIINGLNNATVAIWSDLAPVEGAIVLTVSTVGSAAQRFGYVNAMRLETVPEPGALSLLGIGALTLLSRRRRASA